MSFKLLNQKCRSGMRDTVAILAKFRAAVRRVMYGEEGVSTVEYAVLLATVATCGVMGIYCIGQLSKTSFNAAATAMGSTAPLVNAARGTQALEVLPEAVPTVSRSVIVLLVGAFVIGCGSPLLYIAWQFGRQRPEAKEKEEEAALAPEAVPTETDLAFEKRQRIRRVFENNMSSLLKGELRARHIMSRQVTCVRSSAATVEVAELFEAKSIAHVLVRDKSNKLVGIISQRDLADRQGKNAADIMTSDPFTLDIESKISVGITHMICRRVSCLPVLGKNNSLTGVITTTDFLMAFQCSIQTLDGIVDDLGISEKRPVQPREDAVPESTISSDNQTVALASV